MNNAIRKTARQCGRLIPGILIATHLLGAQAFAAENAADWRPVYDVIMLWVNFGILVFLIYYYGRKPIANFLKGQQDDIAGEIKELEERKKKFEDEITETRQMIQESSSRFEKIKDRITEEGRRKRQEIIDRANEQSRKLLEIEKKKASNQILQARDRLMSEIADKASDLALSKLPTEITRSDQENMLALYLEQITAYSQKAG